MANATARQQVQALWKKAEGVLLGEGLLLQDFWCCLELLAKKQGLKDLLVIQVAEG